MTANRHKARLRLLLLSAWVLGIVFPVHALRTHSQRFADGFDWVFHTHASHVLMHAALYAVLAFLLASTMGARRRAFSMIVLVLIAFLQESIQVLLGGQRFAGDEIFDVGVDLMGGCLGFALHAAAHRRRELGGPERWAR